MALDEKSYRCFRDLMRRHAGIHLGDNKMQLVASRLQKRLRALSLSSYEEYCDLCRRSPEELQTLIDTLTTNETSFFREPHHFHFLREEILPGFGKKEIRAWSAAASIGAEAYSLAMLLEETFSGTGTRWEVIGTDINSDVIAQARTGLYPAELAAPIEQRYLKRYCLKGVGSREGFFLIDDPLRQKTRFHRANLMEPPASHLGTFDVIFLRNMLIYFDNPNKAIIANNVLRALRPGGLLFIGHSESLSSFDLPLRLLRPTIYVKEG